MTSIFEEKFNYEQYLKDLEISLEQKHHEEIELAREEGLVNLIKLMIDSNIPIENALKYGYTKEQIDTVLQKLDSDK